jgi:hypothetical protein
MIERHRLALLDPMNGTPGETARHRYLTEAGDGALITTILAVDR